MRKWRWKCQWGEERKYSGYKNQIFVSGLLPSCKCPPFGASQFVCVCVCVCVAPAARQTLQCWTGGGGRKGGRRDTMRSLSFTHACPSLTGQKYQHLYLLSRCAEDKHQKWQETICRHKNTNVFKGPLNFSTRTETWKTDRAERGKKNERETEALQASGTV